MNLQAIGVIVIGAALLALVLAFIFSSNFRKDVIASEGEAAVLGIINVKGVIIVLLTAVFSGILVLLVTHDKAVNTEINRNTIPLDSAIVVVAEKAVVNLSYEDQTIKILANKQVIGDVKNVGLQQIKLKKSPFKSTFWDIFNAQSNERLSGFEADYDLSFLQFKSGSGSEMKQLNKQDSTSSPYRYTGDEMMFDHIYHINNSSLVVRIDSVSRGDRPNYWISFGEDLDRENPPKWMKNDRSISDLTKFAKTENGRLQSFNQFKVLFDKDWQKVYFVGIGLGMPGTNNHKVDHVDLVTLVVFEFKLVQGDN